MVRKAPPKTAASATASSKPTHTIGLISCIAFAVGSMIGGGVFALSGVVVNMAGPGAVIAYVLAGLVVLLSALCFAVVASRATEGDSGYTPVGQELGHIWQFITMWAFYIVMVTGASFVLLSFGDYLQYFFKGSDALIAALIASIALIILNLGNLSFVGKAETVMVVFKVSALILMAGFGIAALKPDHLDPFLPHGTGSVLSAAALLFSAYLGFSVVTSMAGNVQNPHRTVPLAILIALGIVMVVYIGIATALLMTDYTKFGNASLAVAADSLMGHWGGVLIAIAACVSTLSGANASLMASSELIIRMAAQRDIPSRMGKMSRAGHAQMSVFISGGIAVLLIVTGEIESIISYCSMAGIIALILMDLTAFRIAWRGWDTAGIKLPLRWCIPALAIIAAATQIPSLGWKDSLIGTALVAVGLLFYLLRSHSRRDMLTISSNVSQTRIHHCCARCGHLIVRHRRPVRPDERAMFHRLVLVSPWSWPPTLNVFRIYSRTIETRSISKPYSS